MICPDGPTRLVRSQFKYVINYVDHVAHVANVTCVAVHHVDKAADGYFVVPSGDGTEGGGGGVRLH